MMRMNSGGGAASSVVRPMNESFPFHLTCEVIYMWPLGLLSGDFQK